MLKRVTWFVTGAVAGAAGAGVAKRKVRAAAAQLTPANVVKTAAGKVRAKGQDVADAVRDGRAAAKAKEAELRANLDGAPREHAAVGEVPVEAGQVIVLRDVDDADAPSGPRRNPRRRRRP